MALAYHQAVEELSTWLSYTDEIDEQDTLQVLLEAGYDDLDAISRARKGEIEELVQAGGTENAVPLRALVQALQRQGITAFRSDLGGTDFRPLLAECTAEVAEAQAKDTERANLTAQLEQTLAKGPSAPAPAPQEQEPETNPACTVSVFDAQQEDGPGEWVDRPVEFGPAGGACPLNGMSSAPYVAVFSNSRERHLLFSYNLATISSMTDPGDDHVFHLTVRQGWDVQGRPQVATGRDGLALWTESVAGVEYISGVLQEAADWGTKHWRELEEQEAEAERNLQASAPTSNTNTSTTATTTTTTTAPPTTTTTPAPSTSTNNTPSESPQGPSSEAKGAPQSSSQSDLEQKGADNGEESDGPEDLDSFDLTTRGGVMSAEARARALTSLEMLLPAGKEIPGRYTDGEGKSQVGRGFVVPEEYVQTRDYVALRSCITMARNGGVFEKYKRHSKVTRLIWFTSHLDYVLWGDQDKFSVKGFLPTRGITQVRQGVGTHSRRLSIVTNERTLELEAANDKTAQAWVTCVETVARLVAMARMEKRRIMRNAKVKSLVNQTRNECVSRLETGVELKKWPERRKKKGSKFTQRLLICANNLKELRWCDTKSRKVKGSIMVDDIVDVVPNLENELNFRIVAKGRSLELESPSRWTTQKFIRAVRFVLESRN